MSDTAGTDAVDTGAPVETSPGPSEQADSQPAGGGHPAWSDLRTEVGETTFKLLEPHLKKFDTEAQGRISRLDGDLKRYSELGDYESLQVSRTISQQLEADPVGFYNNFQRLLQERGLLEAQAAVAAQAEADAEDEDVDPRDAKIAEMEAALERIQGTQSQEQMERQAAQWQTEWDQSYQAAKAANPWLTDEDDGLLRTLAQRHIASDDDQIPDVFQKALTDLSNYRSRTLSTPRANESAPRLVQAGGGNPAAAAGKDVKDLSRRETVDLVAAKLAAMRDQE